MTRRILVPLIVLGALLAVVPAALAHGPEHITRSKGPSLLGAGPDVEGLGRGRRLRSRGASPLAHDSHYFFGPSAIPLEGGQGYYQNVSILMHSAYFAPVTGLQIGAGLQVGSLITSIATRSGGPIVHLRVGASGRIGGGNMHLGGFAMGARVTASPPFNDREPLSLTVGIAAMQATFGGELLNVTLTGGWGYENGQLTDSPVIGLSGLWHITDLICFVTENWQLPFGRSDYRIFSYGARFTHRKMAFDAGFAVNKDLAEFFVLGVPLVGFALRF